MNMKTIIAIATLLLISCNSTNHLMNDMPALPDEPQLGHNVLSRDTVPEITFPVITEDQRTMLHLKSGVVVPDSTRVIGVREIEGNRTLEAYLVPLSEDPNDFEVYLMTRGSDGYGIHCIMLGKFHTSEHQGPMRFGGNRFYTFDTSITFDGTKHIVLHRILTLTSIYLKDHSLTEGWRVEWDDHYEIDDSGFIGFSRQQETYRTDGVDDPVIDDYKSTATRPTR